MNFKGQPHAIGKIDGLPAASVTTLMVDGQNVWVGGSGYVALVDMNHAKFRKYAYVKTRTVDRIQIGGGYVWAQFDWHLYRASLRGLE